MTSNTLDTPKVSAGFDINAQFRAVMHELGLSPEDTGGSITFIGEDPIFPTKHRLGACIGIPIMAGAAGVADIWRQRSGRGQDLTLDTSKENSHTASQGGSQGGFLRQRDRRRCLWPIGASPSLTPEERSSRSFC
jgi:hypothetical protein